MHFGEAVDEARLEAIVRPGSGIDTVITADAYGAGEADALLGRALAGVRAIGLLPGRRDRARLLHRRAGGREGLPALHRPAAARPGRLRATTCGWRPRAASSAWARTPSTCCSCTTPTAPATRASAVWDAMAALRDEGLTGALGVAPGPANGFTLDLIDCLERFGDRIDWAMVILNPLEPWPGELVLDAARRHDVRLITRVVDYGGLFHDDVLARPRVPALGPPLVPAGRLGRARPRADGADAPDRRAPRADDAAARLRRGTSPTSRSRCVAPTLIQELGDGRAADRGQARRARRRLPAPSL